MLLLRFLSYTCIYVCIKLGRYHDIIEYRDTNLETISISDRFGFNRNIDISRYIAISIKYRNIAMYFLAETSCTP